MESSEIEREYNTVKRSLDALGYHGHLDTESVSLVNRILSDLIKATKSFKKVQQEKNTLLEELKIKAELVLPLRNENLKLAKENNDLHRNIIKMKDELEIKTNSINCSLKKLQNENTELKFLLTQKDFAIKQIEQQNESLRHKLNDIFNKLYLGEGDKSIIKEKGLPQAAKIISNVNPSMMNYTYKKPSFELSEKLNNKIQHNTMNNENLNPIGLVELIKEEFSKHNLSKEAWANDLKMAANESDKLRNEIKLLKENNNQITEELQNVLKCLQLRDIEIKRLQDNAYLNENNNEEIKVKYKSEFIQSQNEKLLTQIDFLNRENHRLGAIDYFHNHRCREEEVKRLDELVAVLTKENEKLKKTLERFNLNENSILTSNTSFYKNRSKINSSFAGGKKKASFIVKNTFDDIKNKSKDVIGGNISNK